MRDKTFRPDRVKDYFLAEWKVLLFVTASGLIYNIGLLAGPWFEGKMTGELVDILTGSGTMKRMAALALCYVVTVLIVQGSRYFKRFYVFHKFITVYFRQHYIKQNQVKAFVFN